MVIAADYAPLYYDSDQVTSTLVPGTFPVALAGRPYVIEPKEFRRGAIPLQKPSEDNSGEPGEQSLNPESQWRRSQSNWSLGAGQTWLDEVDADRNRFNASSGVDVFTERQVSLLPATEQKLLSGASNLRILPVGAYVYVVDGEDVLFGDLADVEGDDWATDMTAMTGLSAGNVLDITTNGTHVFVLANNGDIYRTAVGTTAAGAVWYNPTAAITRIWVALGRLIAAAGRELLEVSATPGEAAIFSHPDPEFRWNDVVGTPAGLFAAGASGTRGEVRRTVVSEDGSDFEVPVVVGEFREEPVYALHAEGPALVLGTGLGFRVGVMSGNDVAIGAVVDTPGAVRCLAAEVLNAETFVLFGWSNVTSGVSGLGRIRLSRFVEAAVPAYASDVTNAAGGTVISCASWGGRRLFASSGEGVFGSVDDLVEEGWLSTGRIRYSLLDRKVFADLTWQTAPLDGTVEVSAVFDEGSVRNVAAQGDDNTTRSGPHTLGPTVAEWCELTFTLTRSEDDAGAGPLLRWWMLNALPGAGTTERIILPIILGQKVKAPSGAVHQVDPQAEVDFVRQLCRNPQVVTLQLGDIGEPVHVVNFEERPYQWNHVDQGHESLLLVELHTL